MPELVPVRVRDCACPDLPHAEEGDLVFLAPKVSLELGVAATQALVEAAGDSERLTRLWLVAFVRYGAKDSNFLQPFDVQALIDDYALASPVAEAANDLYAETLLRPLGLSLSPTSADGQTAGSTSPTPPSHPKRRKSS